jgi:hypothetical protein
MDMPAFDVEGDNMKSTTLFSALLAALVFISGCYASSTRGERDSGSDAPDGIPGDGHEQDVPADPVPDSPPPDLIPDAPPAPYAFHEWGVISITENGRLAHGPAPISPEIYADKPVIYLYPDEEIYPLDIRVNFASGAASEVWPTIPLGPQIEWSNLSLRPGPCEATPFPFPDFENLCEVCNLWGCLVDEAGCIGQAAPDGTVTISKLLFYAGGVGGYTPPLETNAYPLDCAIDAEGCMNFHMKNGTSHDIEDIWLVYRQAYGDCIEPFMGCPLVSADLGFRFIERVPAGQETNEVVVYNRYDAPLDPDGWPTGDLPLPPEWLDLDKDLLSKLVERGLTESEAGAFVRNWDTVFFGIIASDSWYVDPLYSDGAIVIYFMSPEDYGAQFPLAASPPPRELVRVGMIYQKLDIYER